MGEALLVAEKRIGVPVQEARQWFLALQDHPERYQFDTHAGFTVTNGTFGQEGSRFQTKERFHGIPIMLAFELTKVDLCSFRFRLRRPPLPIWGSFLLEPAAGNTTKLSLEIGATAPISAWFLSLPLVRKSVQGQIQREVDHIQTSMERFASDTTSEEM